MNFEVPMADSQSKKQPTISDKKPLKKQSGPPPMTLHIDDTPENVAKALFGIKAETPGKVNVKREK